MNKELELFRADYVEIDGKLDKVTEAILMYFIQLTVLSLTFVSV